MVRWNSFFALILVLGACSVKSEGEGQSESSDDRGRDGAVPRLYAACEHTSDCQGSGLLCDPQRGCVHCLKNEDCPSVDVCRLGVCEPATAGAQAAAGREGGVGADDASGASSEIDPENTPGGDVTSSAAEEADDPEPGAGRDGGTGSVPSDGADEGDPQTAGETDGGIELPPDGTGDSPTGDVPDSPPHETPVPLPDCMVIDQTIAQQVPPAGLQVQFRVLGCDGSAVPSLQTQSVDVINGETGRSFNQQDEGGRISSLQRNARIARYSVLALDLSDSIVSPNPDAPEESYLPLVLDGARAYIQAVVRDAPEEERHSVAILAFGSTEQTEVIRSFTTDAQALDEALASLEGLAGRGTTNLYGAYVTAMQMVSGTTPHEIEPFVVMISDGTHEAGAKETLRGQALDWLQASNATAFAIGVGLADNACELEELAGRGTDGPSACRRDTACTLGGSPPPECLEYLPIDDFMGLSGALQTVAARAQGAARSHYSLGICTPVELGAPSLTIKVDADDLHAESTPFTYGTSVLTGDLTACDAEFVEAVAAGPLYCPEVACRVACVDMLCGRDESVRCGECDATSYCNDQFSCSPACVNRECGTDNGVGCGDCSEKMYCDDAGQCKPACEGWSCGNDRGASCGSCPTIGDFVALAQCQANHLCCSLSEVVTTFETETARGVTVAGDYLYTTYGEGLGIYDISNPASPTLKGDIELPDWTHEVVVSGQIAYVATSDEGVYVIDVSNPAAPSEMGHASTPGPALGLALDGNRLYVAVNAAGVHVLDVSTPSTPVALGTGDTEGAAHAVAVEGNFAYLASADKGVRIVDISDPANAAEVGAFEPDENVEDIEVLNGLAYVPAGGLRIVDVSDPTSPTELSHYEANFGSTGIKVRGGRAYLLQSSQLHVVDIADPNFPFELAFEGNVSSSYDLAISDDRIAFVASWSHIDVFDVDISCE